MSVAVVHNYSDEGRCALAAGKREALSRRTELIVIHALSGFTDARVQAQEFVAIEMAVHSLAPEARVAVRLPDPDATSTLVSLADEVEAELVVIGSSHRSDGGGGKFVLGHAVRELLMERSVETLLVGQELAVS